MKSKKKNSNPSATTRRRYRITRVYTRKGDRGSTRLVGGQIVKKNDPRIESYGTIDELGVWMGQGRETLRGFRRADPHPAELDLLDAHLMYIQNLLFTLGGDLATRLPDRWEGMPTISADHTRYVERLIDAYNHPLPPLKDFILAGGGQLSLALHACRVVCRRAERVIQTLADAEDIGPFIAPFVNRLSDLFFVLARWGAMKTGGSEAEAIWDRALAEPEVPGAKSIPPS